MVMMLSAMEKNENLSSRGEKDKTEGKKNAFQEVNYAKIIFGGVSLLDGRSASSGHLRLATPIRPTNT